MSFDKEKVVEIICYLESMARLEEFFLYTSHETGGYLLNYFDEKGVSWSVMEDDEDFLDLCVEYLKENNVHEVSSHEEMDEYIQDRKRLIDEGAS